MISDKVGDILLRSSSSSFSPRVHAVEMNNLELIQETYNKLTGVHVVDFKGEIEDLNKLCFFRVECGLRLVNHKDEENEHVEFELKAEFDVPFCATSEVSKNDFEAFSDNPEIMTSVWPYWKEFVQSICLKSGINPLKIPPFTPLKRSKFSLKD